MIKRILVPLDGSELSESALPCAVQLARRHQSETVLAQVVPHLAELAPGLAPELVPELQTRAVSRARNYLENRASLFAPLVVSPLTRLGSAREEIPALAERCGCDLLVLASHGRDGAEHWFLGSTAEGILRASPCPVLLVRPPARGLGAFQNILVPVDGSPASLQVLRRMPEYLAPGGQITLLQSGGLSLYPNFAHKTQLVESYLAGLESDLRLVAENGPASQVVVLDGEPVDDILSWSRTHPCDLIAMSSHGRSGFRRFWLGSVAEKVSRQAPCDVLIFPHSASAKASIIA